MDVSKKIIVVQELIRYWHLPMEEIISELKSIDVLKDEHSAFLNFDSFQDLLQDVSSAGYEEVCSLISFFISGAIDESYRYEKLKILLLRLIDLFRSMSHSKIKNIKITSKKLVGRGLVERSNYIQYMTISSNGRIFLKYQMDGEILKKVITIDKNKALMLNDTIRDIFETYIIRWWNRYDTNYKIQINTYEGETVEWVGDYPISKDDIDEKVSLLSNYIRYILGSSEFILFDGEGEIVL